MLTIVEGLIESKMYNEAKIELSKIKLEERIKNLYLEAIVVSEMKYKLFFKKIKTNDDIKKEWNSLFKV